MNRSESRKFIPTLLRIVILMDALVFLTAALLNFGTKIPLGFAELSFPVPIWQAGIGEAIIGLALLAVAITRRATIAWVAFWMSVFGIAFGLSSPRVQGPAREIHVILVPLAAIVFGLLMWHRQQSRQLRKQAHEPTSVDAARVAPHETEEAQGRPITIAISWLMAIAAVSFVAASMIHFGVTIPLGFATIYDPFARAAIPEAILAIILGIALVTVLAHWSARWWAALAATLFTLLVTIYGLSVTVSSSRTGDITYHVAMLVILGVIASLLLLLAGRHDLSG
ncbi:MAG: hypothetical protein ACM3PY_15520 [Omnitrophica WOR_2 bacterium]